MHKDNPISVSNLNEILSAAVCQIDLRSFVSIPTAIVLTKRDLRSSYLSQTKRQPGPKK